MRERWREFWGEYPQPQVILIGAGMGLLGGGLPGMALGIWLGWFWSRML